MKSQILKIIIFKSFNIKYFLYYMKKALINNLQNDVYCRIKPSKKHGVGVFAFRLATTVDIKF